MPGKLILKIKEQKFLRLGFAIFFKLFIEQSWRGWIARVFIFGSLMIIIPELRPIAIFCTPFSITFLGFAVLYKEFELKNYKALTWAWIVVLFAFFVEVIGTHTGVIFGGYTYGDALGINLFDAPVLIGLNWLVVTLGGLQIAKQATQNTYLQILLTGGIAVVFDFVLEPVAIALGYWKWDGGIIPFQNYIAWFFIAVLISISFKFFKIKLYSNLYKYALIVQFLFFLTISFFL